MDEEVEERPTSSEDYGDAEIIAAGGIVEDDWRLPKYNPLGRLAFGPPPKHRLEVLPFLQSVALRYKKDLKRLFKSYTNIYGQTRSTRKKAFDDEKIQRMLFILGTSKGPKLKVLGLHSTILMKENEHSEVKYKDGTSEETLVHRNLKCW